MALRQLKSAVQWDMASPHIAGPMNRLQMQQLKMPLLELPPTRNIAGFLNYEIKAIPQGGVL